MFDAGFELKSTSANGSRTGVIRTPHGDISTPVFAPDATYGAIKHLSSNDLMKIGLPLILSNTYHLWIRPGIERIKLHGGLHAFMNWTRPILTDSGGYQVFSMVYEHKMGKVYDDGVEFRDHIDGTKHFLTPEEAIRIQLAFGSDIIMVLDYPIAPDASDKDNQRSVELTSKWAQRCKNEFYKHPESQGKLLFGIAQGASDTKMRARSLNELVEIGFDGYGYGGPPVNDEVVAFTASIMPQDKSRYMMGAGKPDDIRRFTLMGYDMFDCVIPTRNARHGLLYTSQGELRITNSTYAHDLAKVDPECDCELCTIYSRSYLHHLFKVKEPLASRLATIHNLRYFNKLMNKYL